MCALVGPRALEGTYTVKMIKGTDTYTTERDARARPARRRPRAEDRGLQRETALKLYGMVERLAYPWTPIVDARDQVRAARGGGCRRRTRCASGSRRSPTTIETPAHGAGVVASVARASRGEEKLREELGMLYGNVNRSRDGPRSRRSIAWPSWTPS